MSWFAKHCGICFFLMFVATSSVPFVFSLELMFACKNHEKTDLSQSKTKTNKASFDNPEAYDGKYVDLLEMLPDRPNDGEGIDVYDATSAIERGLKMSRGGILHIPCGKFKVSRAIVVSDAGVYKISGNGRCSEIHFHPSSLESKSVFLHFNPSQPCVRTPPCVVVEGLNLIATSEGGGDVTAIDARNEPQIQIINNYAEGWDHFTILTSSYAPLFSGNKFVALKGSALTTSRDATLNGAKIEKNSAFLGGFVRKLPVFDLNSDGSADVTISNNDLEQNYSGVSIENSTSVEISGNYVEDSKEENLKFLGSQRSSASISGNWFGTAKPLDVGEQVVISFTNNTLNNFVAHLPRHAHISADNILLQGSVLTPERTVLIPNYKFHDLPKDALVGSIAYCSDCVKPGDKANSGTGVLVYIDKSIRWMSSWGSPASP